MPIRRESFCDRPQPGMMPTRACVSAKRALVEAINKSQASASSNPPVMATPLTAPITGFPHCSTASTGLSSAESALAAPRLAVSAPSSLRSSPAVKARVPAPVSTTARTAASAATCRITAASSRRSAPDSAFIASGRLRVTIATGPSRRRSTRLLMPSTPVESPSAAQDRSTLLAPHAGGPPPRSGAGRAVQPLSAKRIAGASWCAPSTSIHNPRSPTCAAPSASR